MAPSASRVSDAGARKFVGDAALDALDRLQTAHVCNVRRLAGPGRDRARTRDDDDNVRGLLSAGRPRLARQSRSVGQQRLEDETLIGAERAMRLDEVNEARGQ